MILGAYFSSTAVRKVEILVVFANCFSANNFDASIPMQYSHSLDLQHRLLGSHVEQAQLHNPVHYNILA